MIDIWQISASGAAMLFNLSFFSQVKMTWQTKDVESLSATQWAGFSLATMIFIGFYASLHQWVMVGVSLMGLMLTMSMVFMIVRYKIQEETT